ncbi:unnamed protein product [Moneuplotes crassus]|uniref:Uncharacterized protein n=1 Tax=Euplotes crassus TaxID=5936 RepID=A0AAD1U4M6_EUPCR|nr:unnamed protein product [Moneuplotes crassus]
MNLPRKSVNISVKNIIERDYIKNSQIELHKGSNSCFPPMRSLDHSQHYQSGLGYMHPPFPLENKKIIMKNAHDQFRSFVDLSQSLSFDQIQNDQLRKRKTLKEKTSFQNSHKEANKFEVNFKMPKQILRSNLEVLKVIKDKMEHG